MGHPGFGRNGAGVSFPGSVCRKYRNQLSVEDGLEGEESEEGADAEGAGAEGALALDSPGFAASFDSAGLDSDVDSDEDSELFGA